MTARSDIEEARGLLFRAEAESDPSRKLTALDEALDLLEIITAVDSSASEHEKTLAANLRRSHTRRLLEQLVLLRHVDMKVWFDYVYLLFRKLKSDVEALVREDPRLQAAQDDFFRLWSEELRDVLERK